MLLLSSSFAQCDAALMRAYLFHSPFKISRKFLSERTGEALYAYGETPLTTLELIVAECGITSRDVVYELGCGRGRTCFWLSLIVRCQVVGVEYIPYFIEEAQKVKDRYGIKNLDFRLGNFLEADLSRATVVYLYGTCLPPSSILQISQRLSHLPVGTKVITVSYSLLDYDPKAPFKQLRQFSARFTWGKGDVYLLTRI